MTNTAPILSICIPTYNRAPLLRNTLASITDQAAFADGAAIEIVVSDNGSEDDTRDVVAPFVQRFGDRVRYFHHAETLTPEANFEFALRQGRGSYLKLHNDNLMVNNGALAEMLKVIQALAAEKPIIFFTNGNKQQGQQLEVLTSFNDFVRRVSYFATWIGGFGMWREECQAMHDLGRAEKSRLIQTDVLFRLMAMGKRAIVIYDRYFSGQDVGRKGYKVGGYNIAEVFGKNYLGLLKPYVAQGLVEDAVFQEEKKALLLHHIIPYYFDASNGFQKTGFFPYMQDYLGDDYFYQAIEQLALSAPGAVAVATPPAADPERAHQLQLAEQWRALNPHNETVLSQAKGLFQFSQLSAGRRSYGGITLWSFGGQNESLRIGHFVSIADDVKFLLGGNHEYGGVSTFPFLTKYFGTLEASSKGPIVVGDDVWIGYASTILSGVTIGQGAIVAAGSMVTKDVAPYSIVGGNPARHIKFRFPPAVVAKLAALDYGRVSDQAILRHREALGMPLTEDNVDAVIATLMGDAD